MVHFSDVRLIIWDLDGTLIDSFGVYAAILQEAAQRSGLSVPDEQKLLLNFHGSLDDSIKSALDLVDGDDFTKLLNDFLRIQENYYQQPESHLYADAIGLMRRLAQTPVRQVVVTNRNNVGRGNASPRYLVEHSSMSNYVADIVAGDEAEYRKPDARVISKLMLKDVAAAQILVIGDQFVDAQLAQNFGCQAVLVNRAAEPIAHLEKLGPAQSFVTIVASLDSIKV